MAASWLYDLCPADTRGQIILSATDKAQTKNKGHTWSEKKTHIPVLYWDNCY